MTELNFPNAVTNESDLFGRIEILAQVLHLLISKRRVPIFVVGERRIGKTSLQNVAIQQLSAKAPAEFQVIHIEPRGISSYSQFTEAVLRRLVNGGHPGIQNPDISVVEFESALEQALNHKNHGVLLCIDEFDEIVRRLGQELPFLIGTFYDLVEKTALPIYFFFTMTSIPSEMQNEISSTLVSVSQIIELKPLSLEDVSIMARALTHEHLEWPPEMLDELYNLSGGHPYFTKLLLSCLVDCAKGTSSPVRVTQTQMDQAVQRAAQDAGAGYALENLYHLHFSSEEKELLLFLAKKNAPLPVSELEKAGKGWVTTAKRLIRRHYLCFDDQTGSLNFRICFLAEWLRSWIEFDLECDKYTQLLSDLVQPEHPVIEVDDAASMVLVYGQQVHLSAQEYKIMRCLAEKAHLLVKRDDLIQMAWETSDGVTDQTIDTAVYRLRKKLGEEGNLIETSKTGRGFILRRAVLLNRR